MSNASLRVEHEPELEERPAPGKAVPWVLAVAVSVYLVEATSKPMP